MRQSNSTRRSICFGRILGLLIATPVGQSAALGQRDDRYIATVRTFADNVLEHGRDVYGKKHTPLFVDGVNVDTREPVQWKLDGKVRLISNLACQQNLFRTLDGLTVLTGDTKYCQAAEETMRYAFKVLVSTSGLLKWGGHVAYDAQTDLSMRAAARNRLVHELKCHYPYYELMWRVDPKATRRFIEAFWDQHIIDWSTLEFDRHGHFRKLGPHHWRHDYHDPGKEFFLGRGGGSTINAGSDLIYAAVMLHRLSGDDGPLVWAKRLARRFADTRHSETKLGPYWHSRKYALSRDHAYKQFGGKFGKRATDSTILVNYQLRTRYPIFAICQMQIGHSLGKSGQDFLRWATTDLAALARHGFNEKNSTFVPMLLDGTRLPATGETQRDFYYKPVHLKPIPAEGMFFWAYAMAYRHIGDKQFWQLVGHIGQTHGLGKIGDTPASLKLNQKTTCSDPHILLGLLELHRRSANPAILQLAKRVGGNIIDQRFHKGLFVKSEDHLFARFDAPEPLALLHLASIIRGREEEIPQARSSRPFFYSRFDGLKGGFYGSRVDDDEAFYDRKRTRDVDRMGRKGGKRRRVSLPNFPSCRTSRRGESVAT